MFQIHCPTPHIHTEVEPFTSCVITLGQLRLSRTLSFLGKIGINLAASWYQPKNPTEPEVYDAVERAFQFELGWFAEPILLTGNYPAVMKSQITTKSVRQGLQPRLPTLRPLEKEIIKGMCHQNLELSEILMA